MSEKEIRTLQITEAVQSKKLRREEAQKLLGISERTLRRYLKWKEEIGPLFVKHGNCQRAPANRKPVELKKAIQDLIREKYFDFNVLHLQEQLKENEGLSIARETLRKWCHELKLVKRSKKRRGLPRYYRDRLAQEGLMLQMDGSHHRWFGKEKSCLIAAIDDATGKVPYAEFFPSEETWACLRVLRNIIKQKGIPHSLYVDRAGVYGGGTKRQNFSQMHRACQELGIHVIYAYSPQAKGRIERLFQTLQDRLIPELRLQEIKGIFEANIYLIQNFLPRFNRDFTHPADNQTPAWKPLPPETRLHEILCLKYPRLIRNDHTLAWNTRYWKIMNPLTHSLSNYEAEIREYEDGSFNAFWKNMKLTLHPTKKSFIPNSKNADKQDKFAW